MLLYGIFVLVLLRLDLEKMGISCTLLTIVEGIYFFCVHEAARGISVPTHGVGIEQQQRAESSPS